MLRPCQLGPVAFQRANVSGGNRREIDATAIRVEEYSFRTHSRKGRALTGAVRTPGLQVPHEKGNLSMLLPRIESFPRKYSNCPSSFWSRQT